MDAYVESGYPHGYCMFVAHLVSLSALRRLRSCGGSRVVELTLCAHAFGPCIQVRHRVSGIFAALQ